MRETPPKKEAYLLHFIGNIKQLILHIAVAANK